jgi:translation initiation factor IF-2
MAVASDTHATPASDRAMRREYVRALVDHSWLRPDQPRVAARPHIALMVAAFAAASALGAGVVLQLIWPVSLPKPVPTAPPPKASAAPFVAVAGWDCTGSGDRGFDVRGRTSKWYTVAEGGWAADGCHGTFESVPMAGDRTVESADALAVWWFSPGAVMTQCDVQVYRPRPTRAYHSAATATQYFVLAGRSGARLAQFVVDEASDPGSWANAGTFPVNRSGIAVELVIRGVPTTAGARMALTQVRVVCTA